MSSGGNTYAFFNLYQVDGMSSDRCYWQLVQIIDQWCSYSKDEEDDNDNDSDNDTTAMKEAEIAISIPLILSLLFPFPMRTRRTHYSDCNYCMLISICYYSLLLFQWGRGGGFLSPQQPRNQPRQLRWAGDGGGVPGEDHRGFDRRAEGKAGRRRKGEITR